MKYIILLSLLLVSCGRADFTWPAIVKIAPNTAPEFSYPITRGIIELNEFMGESVTSFVMDVNTITGYPIVVSYSPKSNGEKAGLAVVYDDICYITVYPISFAAGIVKTVIWHEIAHCAGLGHVEESGQIMSTRVNQFVNYSENKLEFFKNQLKSALKRK
jgi:hypothetical protein